MFSALSVLYVGVLQLDYTKTKWISMTLGLIMGRGREGLLGLGGLMGTTECPSSL